MWHNGVAGSLMEFVTRYGITVVYLFSIPFYSVLFSNS